MLRFSSSFAIGATIVRILGTKIYIINEQAFYNIALFFGLLFLFLILKKVDQNHFLKEFSNALFFSSLLFVTVYSLSFFLKTNFNYKAYISILYLMIFTGLFTLSSNKKRFEQKIDQEEIIQKESDHRKFVNIKSKQYKLTKISFLSKFFSFIHKSSLKYGLALLIIFSLFTVIKLPDFNISFTGKHSMKYAVYVGTAKSMLVNNNLFLDQEKYIADPVYRPDGRWDTFGRVPIIEWGLLLIYKLLPQNSLELDTRIFMNILGIFMLYLAYLFFKTVFNKLQALIITLLIAVNPIINFTYFDTVEDSLLLIFTFLTLIFFEKYLRTNKITTLLVSGLFLGIGIVNKATIFLWTLPMIFLFLITANKDYKYIFRTFITIFFTAILPTLIFRTSIKQLPKNPILFASVTLLWVFITYLYIILIKKYQNLINTTLDYFLKNKFLLLCFGITIIIISFIFIYFTKIYELGSEFLTDSTLIFNWNFYSYVLNNQFSNYLTLNIYILGLISFLFYFYVRAKKHTSIILIFFIGSIFYWITASKVIFFHEYYTCIIMITFCVSIGSLLYMFIKINKHIIFTIFFLVSVSVLLTPEIIQANTEWLSQQKNPTDYQNLVTYINQTSNINNFYIDDVDISPLTIDTGRPRIEVANLINPEIISDVKQYGFSETMKKFGIKYLITENSDPPYDDFINIFTDQKLQSVNYRRSDIIATRLDPNIQYFSDYQLRQKLVEELDIKNKFTLTEQIGIFRVYSFIN